jgi:hypothetical protein
MDDQIVVPQAPENPPPSLAPRPKIDWGQIRVAASAGILKEVQSLQHLNQVSKGKGVPTLHEMVEMFSNIGAVLAALPHEQQELGQTLTTLLVNVSLRLDAVIAVLEETNVIEKGSVAKRATTIIDEQRAAIKKQREESLAKSVEAAKQA